MSARELRDWILSLVQDIEFNYEGIHGVISPTSETELNLFFNDENFYYDNINDLMSAKVICGKSLNDISTELDFR